MSSGPRTGFAEIRLPAKQPGSSIMPGKVNPVMVENLSMICYHVIGNDTAVAWARVARPARAERDDADHRPRGARGADDPDQRLPPVRARVRRRHRGGRRARRAGCSSSRAPWPRRWRRTSATPWPRPSPRRRSRTGKTIRQLVLEKGVFTEDELDADPRPARADRAGRRRRLPLRAEDARGLRAPDRPGRWRRLTRDQGIRTRLRSVATL